MALNPVRNGDGDPTRKFYVGKPQDIYRQDGDYVLSIPLPLVEREAVNLHRSVFDELVVRIGNWKRNIALPMGLAKLDISSARYEGDRLNIVFAAEKDLIIPADELKPKRWDSLKARFRRNRAKVLDAKTPPQGGVFASSIQQAKSVKRLVRYQGQEDLRHVHQFDISRVVNHGKVERHGGIDLAQLNR